MRYLLFLLVFVCCSSSKPEESQKPAEKESYACYILILGASQTPIYSKCLEVEEKNDCGCHDYYCSANNADERIEVTSRAGHGNVVAHVKLNQKCKSSGTYP